MTQPPVLPPPVRPPAEKIAEAVRRLKEQPRRAAPEQKEDAVA